ncbi:MAG TPA: hypothetical protein VM737_09980 [Gemmatimonadota bacterium]|nr:hypothetical protein [Gemmatimonadota bacterium]
MKSGTKVVLLLLVGAAAVALLRTLCVPVGSFRAGLDRLTWGVPADSVVQVLGLPNEICTDPSLDHLDIRGSGAGELEDVLAAATAERWVYSERPPSRPVRRSDDPACQAPIMATELGFDAGGRLRWIVREAQQTPVAFDPTLP